MLGLYVNTDGSQRFELTNPERCQCSLAQNPSGEGNTTLEIIYVNFIYSLSVVITQGRSRREQTLDVSDPARNLFVLIEEIDSRCNAAGQG